MKLGELFIQLGVKGDTKELDKTLKQIEKAEKVNNKVAKAEKALGRELTENEKKIAKIFEAKDLIESLEKSVSEALPAETSEFSLDELQEMLQKDPSLQEKLLQAFLKNKYVKQLIPLFWANQDEYKLKDIDQNTFNQMVIAYISMTAAMQQQMQQLQEMLEQEEFEGEE